jgi:hypothetical protein
MTPGVPVLKINPTCADLLEVLPILPIVRVSPQAFGNMRVKIDK